MATGAGSPLGELLRTALRASAGMPLDEPQMIALVGDLSLRSGQFRQVWARHDVDEKPDHRKRIDHPLVGPLTLGVEPSRVMKAEGRTVFVSFAEPGTGDAGSLALLAPLTGRSDAGAGPAGGRVGRATPEQHVTGGGWV